MNSIDKLKVNKLCVGWLDILDDTTNLSAKVFAQNLTDIWAFDLSVTNKIPIFYGRSVDDLLTQAATHDNDWILILTTGMHLFKDSFLIDGIANVIDRMQDTAIVGHLLDKKSQYYKLHHQTILINLKWFRNNNCPKFGNESVECWETIEPERSQTNFHDDYTPIWVKQGKTTKIYDGKHAGWNLFKTALDSGYKVKAFDKSLRSSKYYIYPDSNQDWNSRVGQILFRHKIDVHFLANTERQLTCPSNLQNMFDVCMFPAGGFNTILIPWLLRMPKNSQVIVYDASVVALDMAEKIKNYYRGDSVKSFWEKYCIVNNDLIPNVSLYRNNNSDLMQEIINKEMSNGLDEWFKEVFPTLNFCFRHANLFTADSWEIFNYSNKKIYLNMSNIFTYLPTSLLFSLKDRMIMHNNLINHLKNQPNDWYLDYAMFDLDDRPIKELENVPDITVPTIMQIFPWNK